MRVQLLGTGSADGWPNAFCTCASCLTAQQRGQWRGPTSALVDDRILLDCGPETPRSALRHAGGLQGVSHILITHDHPDHSAPMALLARAWAGRTEPLTVVGPEAVIASWCLWSAPSDPVQWQVVLPGDTIDAGGYTVRVLAAAHGATDTAVVYDLTSPGGERLLYATDTGPLPRSTIAAAADASYDLVLLEATFGDRAGPGSPTGEDHLDLSSFADQLVRLRGARAVDRHTQLAAVHLSHHSPADLRPRLAAWGVSVVDDGHAFALDRTATRYRPAHAAVDRSTGDADDRRRTLVLGGVRSGKSTTAERLFAADAQVTYVATGYPADDDPEWAGRVARHQARRPAHWTTLETTDVGAALRAADGPVIIDCLGMWLTAVLTQCGAWEQAPHWEEAVEGHLDALVEAWHAVRVPVVAVSNEVGAGVVPATWSGRLFRDQLGRLNTRLAAASERVLLVVAGRALDLTASPPPARHGEVAADGATDLVDPRSSAPEPPAYRLHAAPSAAPAAAPPAAPPHATPQAPHPVPTALVPPAGPLSLRSVDTAVQPAVPAHPRIDLTRLDVASAVEPEDIEQDTA